jgi:hypothetical protein
MQDTRPESTHTGPTSRLRQATETITYVAVVVSLVTAASVTVGLVVTVLGVLPFDPVSVLVAVKFGLFAAGLVVLAYAAFASRPGVGTERGRDRTRSSERGNETHGSGCVDRADGGETPFGRLVCATPPMRYIDLPPEYRVGTAPKLVLTGVTMHALSFVLESVFGATLV